MELLHRQMSRRMFNQDLAFGWTAWHGWWESKTYVLSRLRQVGNKLHRPNISVAFFHWALQASGQKQWHEMTLKEQHAADEKERQRLAKEMD